MTTSHSPRQPSSLGPSLYVPAKHPDLVVLGNGSKFPGIRSIIVCTEDSLHNHEVAYGIHNLTKALCQWKTHAVQRFVRVRNQEILQELLSQPGIERINGFVLPKISEGSLNEYLKIVPESSHFALMPTLETVEVFDSIQMIRLRDMLLSPKIQRRIPLLRIGVQDLLNLIGLKREKNKTIYDTPIALTIAQLVTIFRPFGFHLTAPVFDSWNDNNALQEEIDRDISHGLYGKSAIHPAQIPIIIKSYRVSHHDLEMSRLLLQKQAASLNVYEETMLELATQTNWARIIEERYQQYGLND